jgi:hypothetical protein
VRKTPQGSQRRFSFEEEDNKWTQEVKQELVVILSSIWFVLLCMTPAHAMNVTLWDANSESDLAGYKVYYGTRSLEGLTTAQGKAAEVHRLWFH